MNELVPIIMIGWIIITIFLFYRHSPQIAVLVSIFGGFLFLPVAEIYLPGVLPTLNKSSTIAIGLILGELFSGNKTNSGFQLCRYDLAMLIWCFVCPIVSSVINFIGLYNGLSEAFGMFLGWYVFYRSGRKFFSDFPSIRKVSIAFLIGGMIYIPLILWELRMSPQLHTNLYGYFPHSFEQHIRYGGYRPIVFMEHGIMVASFMASVTAVAFWFWRKKIIVHIWKIPISLFTITLLTVTIFCRTAAGWIYLAISIIVFIIYKSRDSHRFIQILELVVPVYILARVTNIISAELIESLIAIVFDSERVGSLAIRLLQENMFSIKALTRPIFGWGGMTRAWPVDPATGRRVIQMIDSLWLITLAKYGFFGLISMFLSLGIGPWYTAKVLSRLKKSQIPELENYKIDGIVISLIVVLFMIDSLINGMINPIYIFCTGVLVSYYLDIKKKFYPLIYHSQNISCEV